MRVIETNTGRQHSENCLVVQRYGSQSQYQNVANVADEEMPDDTFRCSLCALDITNEQDEYAPLGVELVKRCYSETELTSKAVEEGLRHLITRTDERLQEAGYLDERTGTSMKSSGHWRSQRRGTTNTARFDRLLGDALEICFLFDIAYYAVPPAATSWDELVEMALIGDFGMALEENVAQSLEWHSQYRRPRARKDISSLFEELGDDKVEEEPTNTDSDTGTGINEGEPRNTPPKTERNPEQQASLSGFS
jgi:hypothetical protein